jgi:hypothetical protein
MSNSLSGQSKSDFASRLAAVHIVDNVLALLQTKGKGTRIRTRIASASLQDLNAAAKANNTLPSVVSHAAWFLVSMVEQGTSLASYSLAQCLSPNTLLFHCHRHALYALQQARFNVCFVIRPRAERWSM